MTSPRQLLRRLFEAAIAAVSADRCLPTALPEPPPGRTVVLGAGKAAAAMARAMETHWRGPLEGLVVTRYGHGVSCRHVEVAEASHPVPDGAGLVAAERMFELARGLGPDDLAVCLLSGGGSALLAVPASGIALADKQKLTVALLASGATIGEINTVRKHLSAIKGGRLALACHPARVVTLAISDVPGDHPDVIASGPTVADPTTAADARSVLDRYRIEPPPSVAAHLVSGGAETPKPGDPAFADDRFDIVANAQTALEAAAEEARRLGVEPLILSDRLEGEARQVGAVLAGIARQTRRWGQPLSPPCVLLSGGETTVTVRGPGRGGRNTETLLGLALALDGEPGIWALAADTDGIDGSEDDAGAIVAPDSLTRAWEAGLDPRALLADNDSYRLFSALGDLVVTGPTRTNVNDFRAVLVEQME